MANFVVPLFAVTFSLRNASILYSRKYGRSKAKGFSITNTKLKTRYRAENSTLLIASLFNPLRTHSQNWIDRRFYRSKYDVEKALTDFAETARDEVEMQRLTSKLIQVVVNTMQPEAVRLWLKPSDDKE